MSQTHPIPHSDSSGFVAQHLAQAGKHRAYVQQLEDDICQLAAHIDAAMFRWLELLREFDECDGWAGDGIKSSATAPALPYLLRPCSRAPTG